MGRGALLPGLFFCRPCERRSASAEVAAQRERERPRVQRRELRLLADRKGIAETEGVRACAQDIVGGERDSPSTPGKGEGSADDRIGFRFPIEPGIEAE